MCDPFLIFKVKNIFLRFKYYVNYLYYLYKLIIKRIRVWIQYFKIRVRCIEASESYSFILRYLSKSSYWTNLSITQGPAKLHFACIWSDHPHLPMKKFHYMHVVVDTAFQAHQQSKSTARLDECLGSTYILC